MILFFTTDFHHNIRRSHMNFTHLEYAVTVAKHGSISRAAQELFVSQPYLSSMIKKLEEELSFSIFNRTRNGITVTTTGQTFISSACRILLELHKINELSSTHSDTPLKIASYYSTFVTKTFLNFIQRSDTQTSDSLSEMGVRNIFQSILSGENSLGIFFYAPSKRNAYIQLADEYHCICQDLFPPFHLYILTVNSHPLASLPSVSIRDIMQYNYVCYNDTSSLKYLNILGLEKKKHILQVSDRGSMLDAVHTGNYISVTSILEKPSSCDFQLIPISDPGFYMNSCYVKARISPLTSREHEFICYLRKQFSEQINPTP